VEVGNHLVWNVSGLFLHGDSELVLSGTLALLCALANGTHTGLRRQPDLFPPGYTRRYSTLIGGIGDLDALVNTIGDYNFRPWSGVSLTVICLLASSPCPCSNCIREGLAGALDLATPLATPLPDLNGAFAFALLSSLCYLYTGLRTKGGGFSTRYISPSVALLPINLLEDITKPLSMGFRIFGNSIADDIITGVLNSLTPLLLPLVPMGAGQGTSVIQAWVYTSLAVTYLTESIE
jgi:F-type H+-transporting ATPase subunit a